LGWPLDRPIVATVRRLVPSKGVENLISAIEVVRGSIPNVLAVIAGTGPLSDDLQRLVRERGLTDSVLFTGTVSDDALASVYRAADLCVLPTIAFEGFGLSVVEALASGTATLVTPVGGLPEVLRDLDPSLVLGGTEPRDIAEGILAALTGRLKLPSELACTNYAARFDWPMIASRVRDVYREIA
jgi:glycosyltransferase involved in cell wall biosynthesis